MRWRMTGRQLVFTLIQMAMNRDLPSPDEPMPPRCPRRAQRKAATPNGLIGPRLTLAALCQEPFRVFFPAAVLAGIVGVLLWPLMLSGWMTDYPGPRHARLMIQGFFGGFIFGFLGTSLPRLLETRPLSAAEVFPLLALFLANLTAHTLGATRLGDALFTFEVLLLAVSFGRRLRVRRDWPPPGFVLVALSFACSLAGIAIQWVGLRRELAPGWELLGRLWAYHAFILLCILGAGGFLLPRFLGITPRRKFATSAAITPEWRRAAGWASLAGTVIVLSFVGEATGWNRWAGVIRALTVLAYLGHEMPLEQLRWSRRGVQGFLLIGLICLPLGVLASSWLPGWRVGLSHIELISGFGLIALGVGTRVVFGHSGERQQLERFHPALTTAAILMLLGMLTRINGDLIPSTQATHYLYAAICWIGGLILWAVCVLPKVLQPDPEA